MLRSLINKIFSKNNGDVLVSEERFVPEYQQDVPWARMHEERYRFASQFIAGEDTVFDLACGAGYGTDLLSKHAKKVVGIDKSSAAVDYARGKYAGEFCTSDFFEVEGVADVVVSFETVEHIKAPIQDVVGFLASKAKRLMIFSVPFQEKPGNPFHYHFDIDEKSMDFLAGYGDLKVYYQEKEPGYIINEEKSDNVQNLIYVVTLNTK